MAWLRCASLHRSGLLVLALALWQEPAPAQDYPTRPVSIAVPYAAGGGVDVVTRLVAQKLTERLGQAFIIDNRLGAGGLIASSYVAKAAPDGHTLLLGTDAQLAAQVTLRKALPYDPVKDYVPVALIGNTPFGLIVSSSLPAQSVNDLIRLAKEHPGKISYGSSGAGGIPHLLAELFMSMTGTTMTHVPYKGTAEALRDVVAGHVPVTFSGLVPVVGLIKEGKIRVLGVTSTRRVPVMPDVAPIAESGVPGFEAVAWLMIVAPAGTPKPIVDRLNAELRKALAVPEVKSKLEAMGGDPRATTPDEMKALVSRQYETWKKLAVEANLSIN